jgi:hypothetical protein
LEAGLQLVQHGGRLDLATAIAAALGREQQAAGFPVAVQDVVSIAHGGVTEIRCDPAGSYSARHLNVDPAWIAEHIVIAMTPGKPHSTPTLLSDLLNHSGATGFIETISGLAMRAAAALERGRAKDLANAVNAYRETFGCWQPLFVSDEVRQMIAGLQSDCGPAVLGWKPPGAGAAQSCIIVTEDREAVLASLQAQGWFGMPALVTDGLRLDSRRISCGYRIDFVGAADLNVAAGVETVGFCVSAAIAPRDGLTWGGLRGTAEPGSQPFDVLAVC